MTMKRIDQLLVSLGHVASRTEAQNLIKAGAVQAKIDGIWRPVTKPSLKLDPECEITLDESQRQPFVSRAGIKLSGALERVDIQLEGAIALDVGQSTGGFTDCLLQHNVAQVVGVDVGHEQLAPSLKAHPKVVCLEGVNARELNVPHLLTYAPRGFNLVVMDVSFISQRLILPGLPPLLKPGGHLISLVKPQFEVGKDGIGKGGIVRNGELFAQVEENVTECAQAAGLILLDYFASQIEGGDGNQEFFMVMRKNL